MAAVGKTLQQEKRWLRHSRQRLIQRLLLGVLPWLTVGISEQLATARGIGKATKVAPAPKLSPALLHYQKAVTAFRAGDYATTRAELLLLQTAPASGPKDIVQAPLSRRVIGAVRIGR